MDFTKINSAPIDHKTVAKEMAERVVSFAWEYSDMLRTYSGKDKPDSILKDFSKSLGIGEFNVIPDPLKRLNLLMQADIQKSRELFGDEETVFTGDTIALAILQQLQINEVVEKITKTSVGKYVLTQQRPKADDPLFTYVEAIQLAFKCNTKMVAMINDSTTSKKAIEIQFDYIKLNMLNKFIFHNETKNTNALVWIAIDNALELMEQFNVFFAKEDFASAETYLKSFIDLYDVLTERKLLKDTKMVGFCTTLINKALGALKNG